MIKTLAIIAGGYLLAIEGLKLLGKAVGPALPKREGRLGVLEIPAIAGRVINNFIAPYDHTVT